MAGTLTVQNLQGPSTGANANKIILPSGQTLYAPGHVIQVTTTGQFSNSFSTTSTSYLATGVKHSITPTSASSKIIILMHTTFLNQGSEINWYIARNGTDISASDKNIHGDYDNNGAFHSGAVMHVDTPNTTSSVEYEIYAQQNGASGTIYIYRTSCVTLMEIAQ